jgi:hypothetical protein
MVKAMVVAMMEMVAERQVMEAQVTQEPCHCLVRGPRAEQKLVLEGLEVALEEGRSVVEVVVVWGALVREVDGVR